MSVPTISEATKSFLRAKIGGVDALEILLLLHAEPETEFSPEMVLQQVQTSQPAVTARLEHLRQSGLVYKRATRQSPVYRADLSDRHRTELIEALRELYELRRVALIEALYEPSPLAVSQFEAEFPLKRK